LELFDRLGLFASSAESRGKLASKVSVSDTLFEPATKRLDCSMLVPAVVR
jgi:hypothetical protein